MGTPPDEPGPGSISRGSRWQLWTVEAGMAGRSVQPLILVLRCTVGARQARRPHAGETQSPVSGGEGCRLRRGAGRLLGPPPRVCVSGLAPPTFSSERSDLLRALPGPWHRPHRPDPLPIRAQRPLTAPPPHRPSFSRSVTPLWAAAEDRPEVLGRLRARGSLCWEESPAGGPAAWGCPLTFPWGPPRPPCADPSQAPHPSPTGQRETDLVGLSPAPSVTGGPSSADAGTQPGRRAY